jgi:hypothetical protein
MPMQLEISIETNNGPLVDLDYDNPNLWIGDRLQDDFRFS